MLIDEGRGGGGNDWADASGGRDLTARPPEPAQRGRPAADPERRPIPHPPERPDHPAPPAGDVLPPGGGPWWRDRRLHADDRLLAGRPPLPAPPPGACFAWPPACGRPHPRRHRRSHDPSDSA